MKNNLRRYLPLYVIILFFLCLAGMLGIGIHAYFNYDSSNSQHSNLMLKLRGPNEGKITYRKLLANGKMTKGEKFDTKNEEIINVDANVFKIHDEKKTNSSYLTLGKYTLKDQNRKKVNDSVYERMIKQVAHEQENPVFIFRMFKTNQNYYAFLQLNAGIDDTGTIYKYSFKNKKMEKIGKTDNDNEVVAIKEIK